MWWMAFVQGGLAHLQAAGVRALTNIQNNTDKTVARLENQSTQAGNVLRAAQFSAQGALASLSSQQAAKQAAAQLEAGVINAARQSQQLATTRFDQSIGLSEQAGAQAAAIGASGASGGVVDAINIATSLRAARAVRSTEDQQSQLAFDNSRMIQAMVGQVASAQPVLNNTVALDYHTRASQEQVSQSPFMAGAIAAANSLTMGGGQAETKTSTKQDSEYSVALNYGLGNSFAQAQQQDSNAYGLGSSFSTTSNESSQKADNPYAVSLNYSIGKL